VLALPAETAEADVTGVPLLVVAAVVRELAGVMIGVLVLELLLKLMLELVLVLELVGVYVVVTKRVVGQEALLVVEEEVYIGAR
jgi:hypothetical protein